MTKIIYFFLLIVILAGCSATNIVNLTVTDPAPVFLPKDITRIGVINRTMPNSATGILDKIDKILSVEGRHFDKDGAIAAIQGVTDELENTNRFEEIVYLDKLGLTSSNVMGFPIPLAWNEIEKMCQDNNVDAIFSLAYYDTETTVGYSSVPVTINGPLGTKIPALEHHAKMTTMINFGWRIYDPTSKTILDQYPASESRNAEGVGVNPVLALAAVMNRNSQVMEISKNAGRAYALRILPFKRRVSRDYYVRGSNNFKVAKRMAQTGNWDGAAERWESETVNLKSKIAGRAYYNMAISNEINGDLDAAIDWAQKSYEVYNIKLALRYVNILKDRQSKNAELKMQEVN